MSDSVKLLILLGFNLYTSGLAVCCQLERNAFNEYPWMLKVVADGETRGSGLLVTPYKVMSSASPFLEIIGASETPDLSPITFVGFRLKKGGTVECTVTRKAAEVKLQRDYQDLLFWLFEEKFDVSLNIPFIWTRIEEVDTIAKTVLNMKHDETCLLPVFETTSPTDAKIKLETASFVRGLESDNILQEHCNYDLTCLQTVKHEVFLVKAAVAHMPGQVIICRGLALGAQRLRIDADKQSNKTEKGPTMYDNFGFKANIFHEWAVREWPSTPKPRKTVSTVASDGPRVVLKRKRPKGISTTPIAKARRRTKKTTTKGPPKPTTLASSLIPSAVAMIPSKTTTHVTQMFVRTLPNRVRPNERSLSQACTDSPSLFVILHCSVILALYYNFRLRESKLPR